MEDNEMTKEDFLTAIDSMTVLELHELVEALKDKYGVTAAAPMMMGGFMPGAAAAPAEEEKSTYDVLLTSVGDAKLEVIKAVREILGVGLKEAKELVDKCPCTLKEGVQPDDAEKMKNTLEGAGAIIDLK
jgi:large subunit ribosomal protein L7/L12